MSKIKLIIAGGRDFNDYELLRTEFLAFVGKNENTDIVIISGMARGADLLGIKIAKEFDIQVTQMPADWDKHKKAAGHIRNAEMADIGTHLLALWDQNSAGTRGMINVAKRKGLEIKVVHYTPPPKKLWNQRKGAA